MCVGVPMRIIELDYPMATAEAKGVRRRISVMLIPEDEIKVGDYVMVHVGNAIEVIDKAAAEEIWKAFEEVISAIEEQNA